MTNPTFHHVIQGSDEYGSLPGLNWSTLKLMAKSPRALKRVTQAPRVDSQWLLLGRAIHCAALEPDEFSSRYVIAPDFGDGRTKAAKEAKIAWMADVGSREVLSSDAALIVQSASLAIREHAVAAELLAGKAEQILTWTDAETGLACKGRLDVSNRRIVDLKSSSHGGSIRMLLAEAARRDYHGQCSWYHDGGAAFGLELTELPAAVFVDTCEPFDVVVLQMTEETFLAGRALYRRLLEQYQGCHAANWWPGMAPEAVPWTLPRWKSEE